MEKNETLNIISCVYVCGNIAEGGIATTCVLKHCKYPQTAYEKRRRKEEEENNLHWHFSHVMCGGHGILLCLM